MLDKRVAQNTNRGNVGLNKGNTNTSDTWNVEDWSDIRNSAKRAPTVQVPACCTRSVATALRQRRPPSSLVSPPAPSELVVAVPLCVPPFFSADTWPLIFSWSQHLPRGHSGCEPRSASPSSVTSQGPRPLHTTRRGSVALVRCPTQVAVCTSFLRTSHSSPQTWLFSLCHPVFG